jgi:hypothetical protein
MTSGWAIVIGSTIVGASIIGARVIAPYQAGVVVAADGELAGVWRANTISGEIQLCRAIPAEGHRIIVRCPGEPLPTVEEVLGPRPAPPPKVNQ